MSEIFRERIESSVEPEIDLQPTMTALVDEVPPPGANKATEPQTPEEQKLDIWEGLNRREYAQDYFKIREVADTFPLKAHWKFIDKFIKGEIESKQYEKNIQNYTKIIAEFEEEAGTNNLETYARLQKLFQYITVVKKYREIKARKESFLNSMD